MVCQPCCWQMIRRRAGIQSWPRLSRLTSIVWCSSEPGQAFGFAAIASPLAVAATRGYLTEKTRYLAQIAVARGSLEQRLMRENLIHGCIYD